MILTRDHGAVRELQLDRPPANALSPELVTALTEAVRAAPREGARAIVLSGLPGRFSGGLDVPFLLTVDRPGIAAAWRGFYEMMSALVSSPIPIADAARTTSTSMSVARPGGLPPTAIARATSMSAHATKSCLRTDFSWVCCTSVALSNED